MTTRPVRVELRGFGWRHGGRRAWALRQLDLRIEPGERVLLLGPSGSGKSTLLRALAGLLTPGHGGEQEGTVLLDGVAAPAARARAGLVMQDPESALVMARAGDDVAFGLENHGVPADQLWPRVDAALASVGFRYGRDASTSALSGGEQQRLALAGILALRPGLLLLDEVTANLDPAGVALVRQTLSRVLAESSMTAVIVEHRVETVVDLCTRAIALSATGEVVADGPPDAVFARQGAALAAGGVWVPGRHPVVRPKAHSPGEALLAGSAVRVRYPQSARDALPATDVTVRAGSALAVTGPNGSGKSTLALALAGLLRPTSGEVLARPALDPPRRRPLWRWSGRELLTRIGTVFQDPEHQFVAATVRDELLAGPRQAGVEAPAAARRVDELLDRLGLSALAEANPFTLSGGQQRRLSVGTAIATAPAVVVADEPTFGQDALTWAALVELLGELRANGTGLVLVTHDAPLVDALADERLRLGSG